MKIRIIVIFILLVFPAMFLASCGQGYDPSLRENAKKEILKTEQDFASLCREKGIKTAFTFYADTAAVILTAGDRLISGRKAIGEHYSQSRFEQAGLTWSPDYVDASASGDMGYTYGRYTYILPDSAGRKITYTGVYHTVWKKDRGRWRFVWDD